MNENEVTYFESEKTRLRDIAEEHPEYTRIYMNISREKNVTRITLSKDKGDVLYILSNVDGPYSGYFRRKSAEEKCTDARSEQVNPLKRAKQSTLFNFTRK